MAQEVDMEPSDGPRGEALWQRADQVLPGGGIYLTRSARFAGPGVLPGFFESAEGCRITDVDGRTYLDFLCSNGPILLGYGHPEVEAAARAQADRVESVSFYTPALVELAEALVARNPAMAWAIPVKNGSDAVGLAARVARAATDRSTLILFERAYHGFAPELSLGPAGIPAAHQTHTRRVTWNDVDGLAECVREAGDDLAGVVLNPLDQNPGRDTRPPTAEFLAAIRKTQTETGALLILDDVRHGFRLHPGGSQEHLGVEPDLLCLGKALGNGHAVSALLGTEALRAGARSIPFTATFMFTAVAQRAALATLEVYDRDGVFDLLESAGTRLCAGLEGAAADAGHSVRLSGPPTMPSLRFLGDDGLRRGQHFSREAAQRGALFHPLLNWFV
ncbi:MAG: aminotransferase class III-fold pyridoxal phosphate-dependent enzyme, partial [Myxococcota bacterium]